MLLEAGLYDKGYHANQIAESVIGKYYGEKSRERSNVLINYGDYYFLKDTKANLIDEFRARRKQNLAQALKYYQKAAVAVAIRLKQMTRISMFRSTNQFLISNCWKP
jgi:bisphosphoglycerate-independent phosphoglycerate mutase (AlkP superfamily)